MGDGVDCCDVEAELEGRRLGMGRPLGEWSGCEGGVEGDGDGEGCG